VYVVLAGLGTVVFGEDFIIHLLKRGSPTSCINYSSPSKVPVQKIAILHKAVHIIVIPGMKAPISTCSLVCFLVCLHRQLRLHHLYVARSVGREEL
jgi:hypothetical protein